MTPPFKCSANKHGTTHCWPMLPKAKIAETSLSDHTPHTDAQVFWPPQTFLHVKIDNRLCPSWAMQNLLRGNGKDKCCDPCFDGHVLHRSDALCIRPLGDIYIFTLHEKEPRHHSWRELGDPIPYKNGRRISLSKTVILKWLRARNVSV